MKIAVLLLSLLLVGCNTTPSPVNSRMAYHHLADASKEMTYGRENYLRLPVVMSVPTPTAVSFPVVVTFYTANSPAEGTGNTTKSGMPLGPDTAASRDLPFGTVIDIHGIGRKVITDRGGELGQNHIDVLVPTREEAFRLGVIRTTATIQEER